MVQLIKEFIKIHLKVVFEGNVMKKEYNLIIRCANPAFQIKDIEKEIARNILTYNTRSIHARNKKKIQNWRIDERNNVMFLVLLSEESISFPLRGLSLLSRLMMETLEDDVKNAIVRNRSFFVQVPDSLYSINNDEVVIIGSEICDEVDENGINHFEKTKLLQEIVSLFLNQNPTNSDREKLQAIKNLFLN